MNAARLDNPLLYTRRRRGFLLIDMVFGLILALFLLMVITVAVVKQQRAEKQLGAVRLAQRNVEAAMLSLQAGQHIPSASAVERLAAAAPPGYQWIRLTLSASNAIPAASLIGLVPVRVLHVEAAQ